MPETDVPETERMTLPVLPLPSGVVLPGMVLTIALETQRARDAVDAAGDEGHLLLVPELEGRHVSVGTIATIESRGELPSGDPALVIRAHGRAVLRAAVAGTGSVLWLEADPVEPVVTDDAREVAGAQRLVAGSSRTRHTAAQTSFGGTPAEMASAAVRPPRSPMTNMSAQERA